MEGICAKFNFGMHVSTRKRTKEKYEKRLEILESKTTVFFFPFTKYRKLSIKIDVDCTPHKRVARGSTLVILRLCRAIAS